jgi:hypothetical protein
MIFFSFESVAFRKVKWPSGRPFAWQRLKHKKTEKEDVNTYHITKV